MSDALPLPRRPDLSHYKKLARELQRACGSGDPAVVREWAAQWMESLYRNREIDTAAHQLESVADRIALRWQGTRQKGTRACRLSDAQLFLAREHGFTSWPRFASHLEDLAQRDSPVSSFEAAADAIVNGDMILLSALLREQPRLVHARSTRAHHSTLLHYVSANGVEDFRQKTPKNILEIANLLLGRGAGVNAESEAYGGRATVLALTATSWHPEKAGVQLALMELLLAHGAALANPDGSSLVNACLRNGRGRAAEFLAARGAALDIEGAAGVGRLDLLRSLLDEGRKSKASATPQQLADAFAWACQFGRASVAEFLAANGVDLHARLRHHGQSGLHWAALGGHASTVEVLLRLGARVQIKDESFEGTPLDWALYGWATQTSADATPDYPQVVAALIRAGAVLDPAWYSSDHDREGALRKARSDPHMSQALRCGLGQKFRP